MYIVKITNNTPLCKMVNFSRSVLKIYTGQKKFTRAAPVAPVTNIRYGPPPLPPSVAGSDGRRIYEWQETAMPIDTASYRSLPR